MGSILQPLATTKAVLLPDGKVLIGQGVNRSPACNVDGRPCTFEEKKGITSRCSTPQPVRSPNWPKPRCREACTGRDAAAGRLRVLRGGEPKRWFARTTRRFRC